MFCLTLIRIVLPRSLALLSGGSCGGGSCGCGPRGLLGGAGELNLVRNGCWPCWCAIYSFCCFLCPFHFPPTWTKYLRITVSLQFVWQYWSCSGSSLLVQFHSRATADMTTSLYTNPEGEMLAKVAWKLCRKRKVKCNRELPRCQTCENLQQRCVYPQHVQKPGPKLGTSQKKRRTTNHRPKKRRKISEPFPDYSDSEDDAEGIGDNHGFSPKSICDLQIYSQFLSLSIHLMTLGHRQTKEIIPHLQHPRSTRSRPSYLHRLFWG